MDKGETVATGRGDKRYQMGNTFVYLMMVISFLLRSGTIGFILFPSESLLFASILFQGKERYTKRGDIRDFRSHRKTNREIEEGAKKGGNENLGTFGLLITVYQIFTFADSMPSDFGDQAVNGL